MAYRAGICGYGSDMASGLGYEQQVLGLIENMSFFKCPSCGQNSNIFGHGGARHMSEEMDLRFLGEVPLEIDIRSASDEGNPIVLSAPNSASAKAYTNMAEKVMLRLAELAEERQLGPQILL